MIPVTTASPPNQDQLEPEDDISDPETTDLDATRPIEAQELVIQDLCDLPPCTDPLEVYRATHDHPLVRLSMIVTILLHVRYRLGFIACGILLCVFNFIFLTTRVIDSKSDMPITLNTNLGDSTFVLPACDKAKHSSRPSGVDQPFLLDGVSSVIIANSFRTCALPR